MENCLTKGLSIVGEAPLPEDPFFPAPGEGGFLIPEEPITETRQVQEFIEFRLERDGGLAVAGGARQELWYVAGATTVTGTVEETNLIRRYELDLVSGWNPVTVTRSAPEAGETRYRLSYAMGVLTGGEWIQGATRTNSTGVDVLIPASVIRR